MVIKQISIEHANWADLMKLIKQGTEIVFVEGDQPIARLLPVSSDTRIAGLHEDEGEFWMSEDFDAPLDDTFWLGTDQP